MNRLIARASLTPVISQVAEDAAGPAPAFRRALVVGGTKGIGRGIACALASAGAAGVEIVGRDEAAADAVLAEMRERSGSAEGSAAESSGGGPRGAGCRFWQADLSTLRGCDELVSRLGAGGGSESSQYDLVVFTVGAWPEFGKPLTSEGFPRVAFLDMLSRFRVLHQMVKHNLLATTAGGGDRASRQACIVLSVLACGQTNGTVAKLDAAGRKEFLRENVLRRRTGEEAERYRQPKNVFSTLQAAGFAHDLWLCAAARKYPVQFVGTFPGLVDTGVSAALLGGTVSSVANFFATKLPGGMVSAGTAGEQHLVLLREARRRAAGAAGSREDEAAKGPPPVSLWDAGLGREHEVPADVSAEGLGDWFLAELEKL